MAKSCYDNYMLDACEGHQTCREKGCFSETSLIHGECDCKYKHWCHLTRQHLQTSIRKDNTYGYDSVEQCDFYKMTIDKKMEETNSGRGEGLLRSLSSV